MSDWVILLGHGLSAQEPVSVLFPIHSFPPNCGGGAEHDRFLSRCPSSPQVRLQSPQIDQLDQSPSTVKQNTQSVFYDAQRIREQLYLKS